MEPRWFKRDAASESVLRVTDDDTAAELLSLAWVECNANGAVTDSAGAEFVAQGEAERSAWDRMTPDQQAEARRIAERWDRVLQAQRLVNGAQG